MLKGKTAVVTGGSRGIGEEIAYKLASLGANVAVLYAGNATAAENVCEVCRCKHCVEAKAYQCDVADFERAKELIESVESKQTSVWYRSLSIMQGSPGMVWLP